MHWQCFLLLNMYLHKKTLVSLLLNFELEELMKIRVFMMECRSGSKTFTALLFPSFTSTKKKKLFINHQYNVLAC